MKKTAIIIDDELAGCEHLTHLLKMFKNIEVLAVTQNPEEGINLITQYKPDILFLDVEMPRMSGFEVVEITRNQGLEPLIIFTTGYSQYAIKAIKEQAFDYLLKPIIIDELKTAIERLETVKIVNDIPKLNGFYKILSRREIEILELVMQGKTSKEIGDYLFISKTTVDTHRRNILEKTGTKSTADLMSKIYA